jgi:protoporphyrinogen oxidase
VSAPDHEVVVLGAGPAGLGAADRLAASGRQVCVLEREAHVGGLGASFDVAGTRVDHGSHRLHPSTPAPIMARLHQLLGDDLQRRPRHGRIRMAGRFVAFPPEPVDLVRHLPPRLSIALARDLATSPFRRPHGRTFDATVRASLGPTMAARFYAPYVEKLFGVPASQLSSELARRRVGAGSAAALLRRVMRPDPERGVFYYPRRGYGQIPEVLAGAATSNGAEIRTGVEVVRVVAHDDHVDVHTAAGRSFTASTVWSTLPLALFARLAGAPAYVLDAATRLETRALVLVYLALPRAQWTPFDAHYFPEGDVRLSRCSEPKNYRASAEDPGDLTVLCAEVPCAARDTVWSSTSEDLATMVRDALARSALPTPAPVEVVVRRVTRAYPVYRVGYEDAFDVVDRWATSLPRVVSFGRQGLFAHDNTHHALVMAWAAADALGSDGLVDPARWAAARQRFATHVVED